LGALGAVGIAYITDWNSGSSRYTGIRKHNCWPNISLFH